MGGWCPTTTGLDHSLARDPSWGLTRPPLDRARSRERLRRGPSRLSCKSAAPEREAVSVRSGACYSLVSWEGCEATRAVAASPRRPPASACQVRRGPPAGPPFLQGLPVPGKQPPAPESAGLLHAHPLCAGLPAFPAGLQPWAPRRRREGGWGSPPSRCAEAADGSQGSQSCLGACGHEWQAGVSGGILGTQVRSNFR